MDNINWNDVQDEVRRPVPGGYAAKIVKVEDNTEKKCLYIQWEFADGEFKGCNQETYDTFGFWPMLICRSYKPTALRFFKGFKTAVEMSNRNFVFNNDPQSLVGKYVGVILGEEEYLAKDNTVKTRLYVAETRSGKVVRDGDFKIPELKKLPPNVSAPAYTTPSTTPASDFALLAGDDEMLPF
jgi:hypothetical protein